MKSKKKEKKRIITAVPSVNTTIPTRQTKSDFLEDRAIRFSEMTRDELIIDNYEMTKR